jgi:putative transposase
MRRQAVKVRLYPTSEQVQILAQHFGCARWWWNYGLQSVKQVDESLKFPGKLGVVKAKIHRPLDGTIKTITVSKCPSGKYYASVLMEYVRVASPTKDGDYPKSSTDGKIIGIDLGIKDFAITYDGEKVSKYPNPKCLAKYEKKLAKKQRSAARKLKGSNRRQKSMKIVARVYEQISNVRQEYLHKLSKKIVENNQVVVVENLNVLGMVTLVRKACRRQDSLTLRYRNQKLAKAISDTGWGTFINFLNYKLERDGKMLVEINRWFTSSKLCSNCHYQISELPLDVRIWTCPSCGKHHDRDGNAAQNRRCQNVGIGLC